MAKTESIAYKANFKEVVNEESGAVEEEAFKYDGSVDYNMPDSTEEAVQMWGEGPVLAAIHKSVKIDVQSVCRRYREEGEAQDAVNGFVPGVGKKAAAPTTEAMVSKASKMTPEARAALIAKLEAMS